MTAGHDEQGRGVALLLLAALQFAVMSVFVKRVGQSLPPEVLVLARTIFVGTAVFVFIVARRRNPLGRNYGRLFWRGAFGTIGLAASIIALIRLPLAEAVIVKFLNPLFSALLATIFLKEAFTKRLGIGLLVSMIGVVILLRPSPTSVTTLDTMGLVAAGIAAVASAAAYVTVRSLRGLEPASVIIFWFPLVSFVPALFFSLKSGVFPEQSHWGPLLAIGALSLGAQICLTIGLSRVPAGPGTAVGYVQLPFAMAFGYIFFDETPGIYFFLGAAAIVLGTVIIHGRRR